MANELLALSTELAAVVERTGKSVVAVHARPRFSSSGVFWKPGVIVTAEHTIRREEEITVTLPDGAEPAGDVRGQRRRRGCSSVESGIGRRRARVARRPRSRGISRSRSGARRTRA